MLLHRNWTKDKKIIENGIRTATEYPDDYCVIVSFNLETKCQKYTELAIGILYTTMARPDKNFIV